MANIGPHRKRESTWRTFATYGVTPRRMSYSLTADGQMPVRYEVKGVRFIRESKPAPQGHKRDHAESSIAHVPEGTQLVSKEIAYSPTLCYECGAPTENNMMFCAAHRPVLKREQQ